MDNFAELYDTELTVILDGLITARSGVCRKRASDVCFDRQCREAKRATRRLERAHASASRHCNDRALPSSADYYYCYYYVMRFYVPLLAYANANTRMMQPFNCSDRRRS
jgi:hypothetical protein